MGIKYPVITQESTMPVLILMREILKDTSLLLNDKPPYKGEILQLAELLVLGATSKQSDVFNSLITPTDEDSDDETEPFLSEAESLLNTSSLSGASWEVILLQTEIIYSSLMRLRKRVQQSNKVDPNKVMNFYKTLGALLEKIISMRERGTEAKEIHDFKNRVLDVLDNILTAEQRTQVIEILKEIPPNPPMLAISSEIA